MANVHYITVPCQVFCCLFFLDNHPSDDPEPSEGDLVITKRFDAKPFWEAPKREIILTEEEIKKKLIKQREITKEFPKKDCGKQIMAIYVDIYGNEFREVFKITK